MKYYSCDLHEVSSLALCYGFSHKFDKGKKGFRFLHEMSIIKNTLPPTGKRISCYRYRYKECGKAFSSPWKFPVSFLHITDESMQETIISWVSDARRNGVTRIRTLLRTSVWI